jgi:gliding motility-associated-like protein
MRFVPAFIFSLLFVLLCFTSTAQLTPIALTGFNQDAIAEGGPSSLATTTLEVDGSFSNRVMYTNAFRTFAGIGGGGLPDNGTIVSGTDTYQLAPFTGNNALYIYRNETRSLSLATPASFARVRVLAFTTEGASSINVRFNFSDGTFTDYLTNYSLPDWFNGAANVVLQGFGRCGRVAAAPWNADAFPSNPRMYYVDVPLTCTDKNKLLQSITFANVSTFPNNAPFPNAVIMAISGIGQLQTITPLITPCNCNGPNGSINLTVNGSSSPYTYSWNTTPVQTSATASGLAPGSYTCIITDVAGCPTSYTGVVPLNNTGVLSAVAFPATVCANFPLSSLSAAIFGVTAPAFTWQPGNLSGQSVSVSPAITTTYTLTATNSLGCIRTAQTTVTVNPAPTQGFANNVTVCPGANALLQIQNPQIGVTYNWYDAASGGTLLGSGLTYTANNISAPTTFYIQSISSFGCSTIGRFPVTVSLNPVPAAPSANPVSICPNTDAVLSVSNPQPGFTYNWYNATTAGILLAIGNIYTVNSVPSPAIYYVEAISAAGCSSSTRTPVDISFLQQLPQPIVTLTNTTFTSLSFSWTAVPGATGYEVTTNGGLSFQTPSSGATGTTHTINGLTGNTTVTLQVRALKNEPCETSLLSAAVAGTTLSSKEIFVPNVFTPNGDGRNDILLVYGNYVSSIRFSVFNQWGQLIFLSENINTGWNGIYKGQAQPVGVYAYTLKVILQDGTIINKKGSVNLIR